MTASLAISDGWKVNTPSIPSQRVALLLVMPTWGTITSISRQMEKISSIRAAPRQR